MKRTILSILLICCAISILQAQNTQTALYEGQLQEVKENELRILSWNIKMLPRFVFRTHVGPARRARRIPQELIDDKIDIIVFQEAFDPKIRRILKRKLRKHYPYRVGPANYKFFSIKTNSGIMMFSKTPIYEMGTVDFSRCEGEDCLARKGALLVEGHFNDHPFQLLGTHLEAGGPWDIKTSQYQELRALIDKHQQNKVPQILCGDFNTSKYRTPEKYKTMLEMLDVQDGPLTGPDRYTASGYKMDLDGRPKHDGTLIDFAFYRPNGITPDFIQRTVRIYTEQWSKDHKSLSDHNAVLLRLIFK